MSYICADAPVAVTVDTMNAISPSPCATWTAECPAATRVPEYSLAEGAVLGFTSRRAVAVECLEGRLWITQSGQAGDILLAAGERYRCLAGGKVVVQAVGAPARLWMSSVA